MDISVLFNTRCLDSTYIDDDDDGDDNNGGDGDGCPWFYAGYTELPQSKSCDDQGEMTLLQMT